MTTEFHVFLSHGLESGPGSIKVQALKKVAESFPGVTATALDHRSTRDPRERLQQMKEALDNSRADPARTILVGSSMGGWVAAQTSSELPVLGCFLLAPALALPDYPESSPQIGARQVQIIHGWDDDVVAPMPVVELARIQRLPCLLLADGHRLENSLERLEMEFRHFMAKCLEAA